MAEFNFLKYCKLMLTAAGYPASVQVEILELGFQRNWMCALHTGISNWLPVETVQRDVLKNVVEEYLKVRGEDAIVETDTPDEGNVTQLLKSLGMENAVGNVTVEQEDVGAEQKEADGKEEGVDAVPNRVGNEVLVGEELAHDPESAHQINPISVAVETTQTAVPETPSILGSGKSDDTPSLQVDHAATSPHTKTSSVGSQTKETVGAEQAHASPAQQDFAIDNGLGGQDRGKAYGTTDNISNSVSGPYIGTSDPDDETAHGSRTSSPIRVPSSASTANIAAQENDLEIDGQEGSGSERTVAGTTGSDDLQEQLEAPCEEVRVTLSDIIDQVVRNEAEVTDLDAPAAGNALALLTYDYRKCLVDKRDALKNPGIPQETHQEQLTTAQEHFQSSILANDPHISRIIQSLSAHIWDPSSDQHQPFPHHKNIAAPCTKKMYAEWNLAVNGVLKRFSNEVFMTWKHNKTEEFYKWEELKGVVDMFMLEQIEKGIITGDLEKKTRNKRQVGAKSGPAPKRARQTVEKEDHVGEAGPSGSGSTQKERVDRMRQRYGNLKKIADPSE